MSEPHVIRVSRAQLAAAQLSIELDKREGRNTSERIYEIANSKRVPRAEADIPAEHVR